MLNGMFSSTRWHCSRVLLSGAQNIRHVACKYVFALCIALAIVSAQSDSPVRLVVQTGGGPISGASFVGDRWVVTVRAAEARVWDVATGREVRRLAISQSASRVTALSDGLHVLTGSIESARLWNVETGTEVLRLDARADGVVAVSRDGNLALTAGFDASQPVLWDLKGQRRLRTFEHQRGLASACFSPDNLWFVTGGFDNTVRVRDVSSGQQIRHFPASPTVSCSRTVAGWLQAGTAVTATE